MKKTGLLCLCLLLAVSFSSCSEPTNQNGEQKSKSLELLTEDKLNDYFKSHNLDWQSEPIQSDNQDNNANIQRAFFIRNMDNEKIFMISNTVEDNFYHMVISAYQEKFLSKLSLGFVKFVNFTLTVIVSLFEAAVSPA